MSPRKAMILAAGAGSRLRPVTDRLPKPMVAIGGRPLLEYTIEQLARAGVAEVMINLHHLPDIIPGHFGDGARWGIRIRYSPEPEPLGTAGGVKHVEQFFDDGAFFVWYGDNLSTCNLERLAAFHHDRAGLATIALHEREDPTSSGIVGLDDRSRVTRFLEKPRPDQVFSRWVSAGIFVLEPGVLHSIEPGMALDFGRDVFPSLLATGAALYGYRMVPPERLYWIDTPDALRQLQQEWGQDRIAP